MDQGLKMTDYLVAFRRHAWTFVLTAAIGVPLSLATAFLLPPVYESTAKILVESQQIPSDLARSTVTASAAERLQLIEERLMTRDNLLGVIQRLNLYADRPDMTPTEKVDMLRETTTIEMVALSSEQRRRDPVTVSTFTITFIAESAGLAARVANEFVTMVIEQNLQSRSERASETNDFFKREVERLAGDLLSIEGQITLFKRTNEMALPDSLEFRRSALADLDERMFEYEQRRLGLEESRRALVQAASAGAGALPDRALSPEERQLMKLEDAYTQQSAIYSETHPMMQALAARIKTLRQTIDPAAGGDSEGSLRETEVERQIAVIDLQLGQLAEQRKADEERKAELEQSIAKTPEVEMALNALYRRHSDLQAQYQQVVLKQADAETGEKLEINRQAERFEVIEQAEVPEEPVAPNRMLIAGGGVFGSVALGISLILLAEMTISTIRSPRDIERWHDIHPIVTVPYIRTASEIRFGRLRMAGVALALLVVIPSGLYALDQYYLPLPLIGERLADKLGLDAIVHLIDRRL